MNSRAIKLVAIACAIVAAVALVAGEMFPARETFASSNDPPFTLTLLSTIEKMPSVDKELSGACFYDGYLYTVNRKNGAHIVKFKVTEDDRGHASLKQKAFWDVADIKDPEGLAFDADGTLYVSNERGGSQLYKVKLNSATATNVGHYDLKNVKPAGANMGVEGVCICGGRMFVGLQEAATKSRSTLFVSNDSDRNGAKFESWRQFPAEFGTIKDMTCMSGTLAILHAKDRTARLVGVAVDGNDAQQDWEIQLPARDGPDHSDMDEGGAEGIAYDPENQLLVLCGEPSYCAVYKVKWTNGTPPSLVIGGLSQLNFNVDNRRDMQVTTPTRVTVTNPLIDLIASLKSIGIRCLHIQWTNGYTKMEGDQLVVNKGYTALINAFLADQTDQTDQTDGEKRVIISSMSKPSNQAALDTIAGMLPPDCDFIGGVGGATGEEEYAVIIKRKNLYQQKNFVARNTFQVGPNIPYDKTLHTRYAMVAFSLRPGQIMMFDTLTNMAPFRKDGTWPGTAPLPDFKVAVANAPGFEGLLLCRNRDRDAEMRPYDQDMARINESLQPVVSLSKFAASPEEVGLVQRDVRLTPTNPNRATRMMKPVPHEVTATDLEDCKDKLRHSKEYNAVAFNSVYRFNNCFMYNLGTCGLEGVTASDTMLCKVPTDPNGTRGCDKPESCAYDPVMATIRTEADAATQSSWFRSSVPWQSDPRA